MKSGNQPRGFTIIETMIFLAVSGVLLLSAMILLNGKTSKTEFNSSINEIKSALQTNIANVTDGFYQSPAGLGCTVSSGDLSITGSGTQGANFGCTYVGDVLQFYPSGQQNEYIIYPMIGLQYKGGNAPNVITDLTDAKAIAMYPYSSANGSSSINGTTTVGLQYGVTPAFVRYGDSLGTSGSTCVGQTGYSCVGAVGFFTSFNSYSTIGASNSLLSDGSQNILLIPVPNTAINMSQTSVVSRIDQLTNDTTYSGAIDDGGPYTSPENPDNGVEICFNSGTSNQSSLITVGGSNGPTSVSSQFFSELGCDT